MGEEQMLTPGDIVLAHNGPGGVAWLRERGFGEHLDKYLSSIAEGITWDPNDMTGVPPTPVASRLTGGMRETTDVDLPDDDEDLPPYEEWSHDDLVAECSVRELSVEGSDEELAIRLMEYDEANPEPQVGPDYDALKKSELQQILEHRGLATSGKNDELIARIREDDAKKA
jgi:hypothetical protein